MGEEVKLLFVIKTPTHLLHIRSRLSLFADCHSLLDVRDTAAAGDIMMVVPAPLTELLAHCRPSTASAAVNLLAHLTMLECGFCVQVCVWGEGGSFI